ncbi:hypothetical protein S40285_07544 [Stachybotrys chlorohalonatus IBT 40285]|uniref:Carbonic anhydrase n=1 Tax=Stachybotrys chlorohalonatus (strain IBT 40285) TaxID=1283841 RepID=A0A084QCY6_STAC4|nr:hypothetical protein S40285_07544 [Stachybotrys chlorohalonata IBT 40285]
MKSLFITSLLSMASAMCHYGTTLAPRGTLHQRTENILAYDGVEGALNWHGLSSNNSLCASGTNQSPINLGTSIATAEGSSYNLKIDSYPDGAELENLGSTVQVGLNGSATVADKDYSLVQFHVHTPSEHHVLGEFYPMEAHFVFQASDESLAVIGFMVEAASDSDRASASLTAALSRANELSALGDTAATETLDFDDLISHVSNSTVYNYDGSLTTPPCAEGVKFNIVADPVYIDVSVFRAVKKVIKFNSRFVQNAPGEKNLLRVALGGIE